MAGKGGRVRRFQADDASRLLADLFEDGGRGVTKDPVRSQFWRDRYEELHEAHLDWHAANIHGLRLEDGPDAPASQANGHLLAQFTKRYADLELAEILLSRGANPNVPLDSRSTWVGSTALSWSTSNPELVKLLVSAGARVSAECTQNRIISLHEACANGHLDTVRLLIEEGDGAVALLVLDRDQGTPLIHAAYHGHLPVIKYLLSLGLEVNAPAEESALEVALRQNHQEVAEVLRTAFG